MVEWQTRKFEGLVGVSRAGSNPVICTNHRGFSPLFYFYWICASLTTSENIISSQTSTSAVCSGPRQPVSTPEN